MNRPIQILPHVQPPRTRRKARIASVMAAALIISWGAPAANAYWQTLSSNNGGARADAILAVAAPTASASADAASVSWAQSTTAAGRPVSGYTVARYSSTTGGTKVAAGGGCAGTVAALGCSEAALPAGTWYYTVTPVLAAWAGPESARSGGVAGDSAAPIAPTVSAPGIVNTLNVSNVNVDVTAEAGASVRVTVADAPPVGTPQQTLTQNLTANGSVQTISFNLSTFSNGTIAYTAMATDAAGNESTPGAATSTKDTVAPTASFRLQTGPVAQKNVAGRADQDDQIIITFSEPMNPASICSAWTSPTPAVLKNAGIQVRIEPNRTLKVVVPSTVCPTFTLGTAVLGGAFSTGTTDLVFAGGGNNATALAWTSTATSSTLTITLGPDSGATRAVVSGAVQSTFTSVEGPKDANGNPISLSPILGAASNF
ncbi:hypothetical protein NFC73_18850 [Pseudarthrobacter sp. RMG13]|uniref:Bacterial Ig-like domain-containing protein n=1 Tax=Pseudarthrobacter humi TaxID=2952523 RepID=A0ABT1LVV8_9MICC|nr:hypothetical protein [Pseudarthrobacter humi]MCP9001768.1 hypothetical protein [Pseudarthrobacter humi]